MMTTEGMTIEHANSMPAPTWSWLKMNDRRIEIPAGLETTGRVEIEVEGDLDEGSEGFDAAVASLQARLSAPRDPESGADGRAVAIAATGDDNGAEDLDVPALSSYERAAVLSELSRDIAADFETGTGIAVRKALQNMSGARTLLATRPRGRASATVRVGAEAGSATVADIDLVAAADSELAVSILIESDHDARSLAASTLRAYAGPRSHIDLTVHLIAGSQTIAIDDEGLVLDEDASIDIRHVVLSGSLTTTGLAADLRGDGARIGIDTRYLARGEEERDFNYIIRHRGRRTVSDMDANGVLAGTARKCLRGTIDLVHGCKGAEGSEQETVLLASKGVDNKTIPTILCDEDDVAGNHGATIGHVRPEQLFYAACRGLSQEQTESLFMRAKLEDAFMAAPDARVREAVSRLATSLIPDFEEEIAC
ncbi:MAG: SufD family Fe-S cluster assembly protein [Collinsella sp.]|nr:SufD family Fe-S cluster assembly protein [Collinsella sp.]